MNLYLIDYENVTDTGFMGVKELTAEDTVIVFYSQHTKNISFERHIELSQSPAHFEYIKILKTGKKLFGFPALDLSWFPDRKGQTGTCLYYHERYRI